MKARTPETTREPLTVTVDGATWVFEPTDHPSDYRCGDLWLRDHPRLGDGWSVAPEYHTKLYDMGVSGHPFVEPSPEAAMRAFLDRAYAFLKRREQDDDVLRAHQLLPPAPTPEQRRATVEALIESANVIGECATLVAEAVYLNPDQQQERRKMLDESRAEFRALAEKAMGVAR
jgi:hypothetical protein